MGEITKEIQMKAMEEQKALVERLSKADGQYELNGFETNLVIRALCCHYLAIKIDMERREKDD